MEHETATKATSTATPSHDLQRQCAQTPAAQHPMLALQQSIGNQALQRLIASRYFQAKLQISQPGDQYEQEADRVADTVMRMPDPQSSSPAIVSNRMQISRLNRKCTECEQEEMQRKPIEEEEEVEEEDETVQPLQRSAIGSVPSQDTSSIVHDVLRSAGQPLDASTRAFMEPRFGRDFSDVRVHADTRAAESARAVNALAYTVGQHVVLGQQHSHNSSEGRKLMAHELTHVVQQQGPGKAFRYTMEDLEDEENPYGSRVLDEISHIGRAPTTRLLRTATWAAGTERRNWDAADRTMNAGGRLGSTPPTLNGATIMSAAAAGSAIQSPTFTRQSVPSTGSGGATAEAFFTANATNTGSYQLDSIDSGPHVVTTTKAAVAARATALGMTAPPQCTGADRCYFIIKGKPNNAAHSAAILAHERRHGSDHRTEFGNVIGTWDAAIDASIAASTKYSGSDHAAAEASMWAAVGGTPTQIATQQHNAWMTANNNFHGSPAGRPKRPFNVQAHSTCSTASMDHIA